MADSWSSKSSVAYNDPQRNWSSDYVYLFIPSSGLIEWKLETRCPTSRSGTLEATKLSVVSDWLVHGVMRGWPDVSNGRRRQQ